MLLDLIHLYQSRWSAVLFEFRLTPRLVFATGHLSIVTADHLRLRKIDLS